MNINWKKAGFMLALTFFLYQCGDPLPVEKMGNARLGIQEAESVKADQYAPEEMKMARDLLIESHAQIEKEELKEAAKKADESKAASDAAYQKALPLYTQEFQKDAKEKLDQADKMNAAVYASDEFTQAGDEYNAGQKNTEEGKFFPAIENYKKSSEHSSVAISESENQRGNLETSLSESEDALTQSKGLGSGNYPEEEVEQLEKDIEHARNYLNEGDFKSAAPLITSIAEKSQSVKSTSNSNYAKSLNTEANQKVEEAERNLNDLKISLQEADNVAVVENSPNVQESLKASEDTIFAAKEALSASDNAFADGAYEESIRQSNEAIRLADLANDQKPEIEYLFKVEKKNYATKMAADNAEKDNKDNAGDTKGDATAQSSTHKVKYKECLWCIAQKKGVYGNARMWKKIYKANKGKIKNPNLIYPGQVFTIPPKEDQPAVADPKTEPKEEPANDDVAEDSTEPSNEDTISDENSDNGQNTEEMTSDETTENDSASGTEDETAVEEERNADEDGSQENN